MNTPNSVTSPNSPALTNGSGAAAVLSAGIGSFALALLLVWGILEWRWRKKTVAIRRVCIIAFVLLGLSLALTFPPIVDLL